MRNIRTGGKWSLVAADAGERHFEIIDLGKSEVTLRCVVSGRQRRVARASLDDRALWAPGWLQVSDESVTQEGE